jgi:hypothetical protein
MNFWDYICSLTEADDSATKDDALRNLADIVRMEETEAVIDMYAEAAWKLGATVSETAAIIRANRPGGENGNSDEPTKTNR